MDWFIITKQKSYLMGFAMAYFKHTGTSCAVAIVTNVKITFSANYISFVLRIEWKFVVYYTFLWPWFEQAKHSSVCMPFFSVQRKNNTYLKFVHQHEHFWGVGKQTFFSSYQELKDPRSVTGLPFSKIKAEKADKTNLLLINL